MDQAIKLQEVDDRTKANQRRIEALERDVKDYRDLVSSMATMSAKQETMEIDVKEIKTDIKSIKEKPARRWESVVDKILMTVLGALIMFLLTKIGIA